MFKRSWVRIPAPNTGWIDIFSHWFVVKIVLMIIWKDWNKRKEAGVGPFLKKVQFRQQPNVAFEQIRMDKTSKNVYVDVSIHGIRLNTFHFFKHGLFSASISLCSSFQQLTLNWIILTFWQWLDSNCEPLRSGISTRRNKKVVILPVLYNFLSEL